MISRILALASLVISSAAGQTAPSAAPKSLPVIHERVEVTATRLPETPEEVPAAIEVFTGDELRGRGVEDLRGALAQAIGVDVAPGGDNGPASATPEFWGLKEFDAFLLVVDGVPWGGAFNPALTTLSLADVERIEVLRGPAPVMYGATSFVGVIQVVHKATTDMDRTLTLHGGSFGSGGGAFSLPVPLPGGWTSRLTLDGEREGFRDDRTSFARGHGLWRAERKGANQQRVWFNVDLNWLDQNPASPHPRVGATLTTLVPVDANHNFSGAFLNDHRFTAMGGFDRRAAGGLWSTTVEVSHGSRDIFRGFLQDISDSPDNGHGFREKIGLTDVYLDSHLSWKLPRAVSLLAGADYLHGGGNAQGADFDYTTPLNGSLAVRADAPSVLDVHIDDKRDFAGVYTALEWRPLDRLRIDAGVRLNVTSEAQESGNAASPPAAGGSNRQTNVRASGSVGAIWTAWEKNSDALRLYANYRDTFKPAAIDFGIGEGGANGPLKPETSRSYEGGMKGRFAGGRIGAEASLFQMNFENLVIATTVNGLPALMNAGTERFRGVETGGSVYFSSAVAARATYSFHNSEFRDFVQIFDGVPTQLAGKRLEMTARHLTAFGVVYTPARGFFGSAEVNYTGSRFLDKRNHTLAGGFATIGAGVGYRTARWELRVDGRNLGDRRDAVSESELGDAQYYLMPSRRVEVSLTMRF